MIWYSARISASVCSSVSSRFMPQASYPPNRRRGDPRRQRGQPNQSGGTGYADEGSSLRKAVSKTQRIERAVKLLKARLLDIINIYCLTLTGSFLVFRCANEKSETILLLSKYIRRTVTFTLGPPARLLGSPAAIDITFPAVAVSLL